jgi:hypothetical protein
MSSREKQLERMAIIDEFVDSPANKVFTRLKVYELGYRIFLANFDDWQRSVDAKCPNDPMALIQLMQDRSWVEPYLVEVTRTLHNFVASALTLVDTTRVLYRELYDKQQLMPTYQTEIENRFIKDGTAQFIKDLRQFCQHYRLPLVMAQVGLNLGPKGGDINWGVPISRNQLKVWSGWSATSKTFIDGSETKINLEEVLKQYRDKVIDFNDWFEGEQKKVHSEEWKCLDEKNGKLKALVEEGELGAES